MVKITNKIILLLTAFILLLSVGINNKNILAQNSGKVKITVENKTDNNISVINRTLKIWKLKNYKNLTENSPNINEIIQELEQYTEEELNKKFEFIGTEKTNASGTINIDNLQNDIYYAKGEELDGYYIAPFIFFIPHENSFDYEIKAKLFKKYEQQPPGKVKLIKINKAEEPLEKVGFKLYQRTLSGDKLVPTTNGHYDKFGDTGVLYTDEKGQITITDLPKGEYFFREVEALPGYIIKQIDNDFIIKPKEETEIKIYNEKTEKGEKKFIKIASDDKTKRLQGAVFKVMKKENNELIAVQKNGKDYEVTSDVNGEFKVEDLEYGVYYLLEVTAPKGYSKLSDIVEFTITGTTKTNEVKLIENDPRTPKIPDTGNLIMLIMVVSGFIIFACGYFISKDNKK